MPISINWGTKVITVPQADLTDLGGGVYQLDVNVFRLALKDLEDDEAGMPFLRTHNHNTQVTVGGVTLARVVEIINGYTVTFENGSYAVTLTGANNNIPDVANVNSVSIRSNNSAGLIVASDTDGAWDVPNGVDAGLTLRQAVRLMAAALAGKISGAPTGPILIRDTADEKTRISATVDASGNRTAITTDVT